MASKIHGKQIKDTSIQLVKINTATGQTLALQGTSKIQQAAAPIADNDLTNKYYVDSIAAGFDPKESCRVATIANLGSATYSAIGGTSGTGALYNTPSVLDGVGLTGGNRILVKDQLDTKQNGIYVVGATATWYRALDMDGFPTTEISVGNFTFVTEGSTFAGNGFVLISSGTWSGNLTVNAAPILWTQFSGGGSFIWGDGLSNLGNVINVDLAASSGLTISSTQLTIDSNIAGAGIVWAAGVINVGSGAGITVNADNIQVDYTNVSSVLGGAGLTGSGILNIGAANGITVNADSVGINYTEAAIGLEGNGLTASAGKINVNTGAGITIVNDAVIVDYTNVSSVLGGAGLTGSGILNIGAANGITVNADSVGINYTEAAIGLEGNGLTASAGRINVNAGAGITISNDAVAVDYTAVAVSLVGSGLTASAGKINVNTGAGITISNNNVAVDYTAVAVSLVGSGLTASVGKINVNTGAGITISNNNVAVDYTAVAVSLVGSGLTASAGKINVNTGAGITISNNTVAIDYINVSSVLGGAGLTGSGILNIGAANGITVNADSVGINYTEAAIGLEGNGLTASAGKINVNTGAGITIINDTVQLNPLVAGAGLTFSAGVININVAKGVTFSGNYLFADASTINTTTYLPFVNVATNSTIQSALTIIDSTLSGLQAATFISKNSNPTGTFLSSISIPVAINTGVTFSRQSDGECFVFVNGVSYPVGSATSSDFFFANSSAYSGSLTASNSVYVGQYLWSNVNTLSFDIDTTDEIIVKYNAI